MSFNGGTTKILRNGISQAKESPWDRAGLFSKYSLVYMLPFYRISRKRQLTLEDIGLPPRVDFSKTLGLRLQANYNRELLTRREPSLVRALFKTFGVQLFLITIFDFFAKCIFYPLQTIALGWLIRDTTIYLNLDSANQSASAATVNIISDANVSTTPSATVASNVSTTTPATQTFPAPTIPTVLPIDPSPMDLNEAYWRIIYDAMFLILFTAAALVSSHPFYFQTYHIGMKARVACCCLIYKKSLRLSQAAMSETTVGQMVNLLSNDVNRFDQVVLLMPYLIMAPLQAIIIAALLSLFYLGLYPTLASLVAILMYVIVQTAMGKGFSRYRRKTARRTDERVRLMNEIILAMRIIKMYAWEEPFKLLVNEARRREIITIGFASALKTINQTLFFVSSKIIVFVALTTYVLLGYSFNPEIVFVSIGLANIVRISLTLFFPSAVAYCSETLISCRRINKFLMLPEIEVSPATYRSSTDNYGCKYSITLNKVYATWAIAKDKHTMTSSAPESQWAILRNLTLSIRPGELVLIVGRVGSGKSSLLMAMLGELPISGGRLEINGRVAYASQDPWIFAGTVRENILFGKAYDANRYNDVVRVCALERDLTILIDGDRTIVGERGVSLSGGQKARVNLARALYQDADVYLLDDPLSAVDAPVAKHIFNESLRTFLRRKTVVLATHQLQFLRHANKALVLDRDCPAAFGTLQEVMRSEAFATCNYGKEAFEDATTTDGATDGDEGQKKSRRVGSRRSKESAGGAASSGSSGAGATGAGSSSRDGSGSSSQSPAKTGDKADDDARLIRASSQASANLNDSIKEIPPITIDPKEKAPLLVPDDAPVEQKLLRSKRDGGGSEKRSGTEILSEVSADWTTYAYYLSNATGVILFIWFVLINVFCQGLYQYTDYFLSLWTDSVQRQEFQGANFAVQSFVDQLAIGEIMGLYSILILVLFLASLARTATFFISTLRASINMHRKLFISIIHAPMTFFDFSPIGVLLNRISRDVGFVDETLPATAIEILTIFINISGIMALTIFLDYLNGAAVVMLFVLAYLMRLICARTITRLKQIEGVTRSPVFSHLSTTLSGLATIRAFKVQDDFMDIFDGHQDKHSSAWFSYISAGRWLTVAMDWSCIVFIATVTSLLLGLSLDATNASTVGLLISQVVIVPGPFQWGVRQLIEVESQMTSVQRVKEFSELKSEMELMEQTNRSRSQSSTNSQILASYQAGRIVLPREDKQARRGEIRFSDVSLSYFADEPPVLRNLNFTIKPQEKVGIVGRTGAGKSSIVSVLFRLYDFDGLIELDGSDTKCMSLTDLRHTMSIIPQEPVLFGGTIRKNLDPFNEFSDDELWSALEAVQLKTLLGRYAQGLNFAISEGGSNFSVGQRQLLCLARAVVRRPRILVLDEATASIDPETDSFIQQTIAQQFKDCTVLTIAHRLATIVDSDRVLVLDRGEVREFDTPYELLQQSDGLFSQMINSSAQQAPRLRRLIEEAHSSKKEQQHQQSEESKVE